MDITTTVAFAVGASVGVERLTEVFLTIIFALVKDFKVGWEEKLSGGVKLLLTFTLNAGLYALLVGADFVSPAVASFGVTIKAWQGILFSCLLVGGGSQLVHEFFGFFRKNSK